MTTRRGLNTPRIVLVVCERVVPTRVLRKLGVIYIRRKRQRTSASPTADHLCRQKLFIARVGGGVAQKLPEARNILVKLSDREVRAIHPECLRSGPLGIYPEFVGVAKEKLARLERFALPRKRHPTLPFDEGSADSVNEAKVLAKVAGNAHVKLTDNLNARQAMQCHTPDFKFVFQRLAIRREYCKRRMQ